MTKIYICVLLILGTTLVAPAQKREWASGHHSGPSNDYSGLIPAAVDKEENIFFAVGIKKDVNDNISSNQRILLLKYDKKGQKVWESVYKSPDDRANYFTFVKSIATDADGNVYLGMNSSEAPNDNVWKLLLIKYDAAGNFVWERTYKGNSTITLLRSVTLDAEGFIYMTGESSPDGIILLKYDANDNLLWNQKYSALGQQTPYDIYVDAAGNIYLTGSTLDANMPWSTFILTLKYSKNGDLLWERLQKAGPESNNGAKILADKNNDLYVMYHHSEGGGIITESLGGVIKYDSDGNQKWFLFEPGMVAQDFVIDSAGNSFIVDSKSLKKYNSDGMKVWENMYDPNDEFSNSSFRAPQTEGLLYFPENKTILLSLTSMKAPKIIKTLAFHEDSGEITWSDVYEIPDRSAKNITKADSAFYVLGRSVNQQDLSVIRYSVKSQQPPPPEPEEPEEPQPQPFAIFPNPTNGIVQVQGAPKTYDMLIADEHGKILQRGTVPPGNSTVSFSVFSPGMYILQLTDGEEKIVKKIVKNP